MLDLIVTCIGYALAAAFWACVFIECMGAWRAGRSRRYLQCVGFTAIVIALLWSGLFIGLTPGASAYGSYRYSREVFGRGFVLGSPRYTYRTPPTFNGDGYSIEVFDIPDTLAHFAASPPPEFGTAFPVRTSDRTQWSVVPWHPTPITEHDRKFLDFVLMDHADNKDLDAAKKLLERLANEPGHYIAYFYLIHDDSVSNVDFFLLSPSERVFIFVNLNT